MPIDSPTAAGNELTHAILVDRAVKWLRTTARCGVVLREFAHAGREFPDAMGWRSGFSVMVECKVSRADFFADQKKLGRREGRRLAHRCYYLVPDGLVRPDDVPAVWGLLYLKSGNAVRVVKEVGHKHVDDREGGIPRDELYMLYAELRRYQIHGLKYPPIPRKQAVAKDSAATLSDS